MEKSQKLDEPETVYVMVRRNYKGSNRRFTNILDIGSGTSLIWKDVLHESIWNTIKPTMDNIRIRDANNRSVHADYTIELVVNSGGRVENVRLNVVEHLPTQVIQECDCSDKHVETIRLRRNLVELANGTVVPIFRKPAPRAKEAITLPEEQDYEPVRRRTSNKTSALEPTVLQP